VSKRRPPNSPGASPLVIVCVYQDGMLENPWFRAYRQAKRALDRRQLSVRVELTPASDLPPDVDILVSPPSLADAGLGASAASEHLVTPPEGLRQALESLLDRLGRDGRVESGLVAPRAYAVHRGFQALSDRGRLGD